MRSTAAILKQLDIAKIKLSGKPKNFAIIERLDCYRQMIEQEHLNQSGKMHFLEIIELTQRLA